MSRVHGVFKINQLHNLLLTYHASQSVLIIYTILKVSHHNLYNFRFYLCNFHWIPTNFATLQPITALLVLNPYQKAWNLDFVAIYLVVCNLDTSTYEVWNWYCTYFSRYGVHKRNRTTDGRTDRQTDRRTDRQTDGRRVKPSPPFAHERRGTKMGYICKWDHNKIMYVLRAGALQYGIIMAPSMWSKYANWCKFWYIIVITTSKARPQKSKKSHR